LNPELAQGAFRFLLARYLREHIPDEAVGDFLTDLLDGTPATVPAAAVAGITRGPVAMLTAGTEQDPALSPIERAKAIVIGWIEARQPIDHNAVRELTGLSGGAHNQFVQRVLDEHLTAKHLRNGMPPPRKLVEDVMRPPPEKRASGRRKGWSPERRAAHAQKIASRQAQFAQQRGG
jgi:hypothetical protein